MEGIDLLVAYLSRSSAITYIILLWLSGYLIATIWVYIYRYFTLRDWLRDERKFLNSLFVDKNTYAHDLALSKCLGKDSEKTTMEICLSRAEVKATYGFSFLSVVASTSPFIGLFGTVVGILDTFSKLGGGGGGGLAIIAPAISEALIATAVGIFVAIPSFSAHVSLKRKAYELLSVLDQQYKLLKKE